MRRLARLLVLATLPAGALAAPILGAVFTLRNLTFAARRGPAGAVVSLLNLPFDLLTNSLGFFGLLGFYPLYAEGPDRPAVGWREGSLIFAGGPLGAIVDGFASGFTPTTTVFLSRRAWDRLDDQSRDRLVNHELWHARRQFLRYSGWIFWPAYLTANVVRGTHRRNPFESGRRGAYHNVDELWDRGYRESVEYVACADPFWRWRR